MILICMALEEEARSILENGFVRRVIPSEPSLRLWENGHLQLVITGIGAHRVENALNSCLRISRPERVLNLGTAASLTEEIGIDELVTVRRVYNEAGAYFLEADPQAAADLVTCSEPVASDERRTALRERFGAHCADMEAWTAAFVCLQHRISCNIVKVISDMGTGISLRQFKKDLPRRSSIMAEYIRNSYAP